MGKRMSETNQQVIHEGSYDQTPSNHFPELSVRVLSHLQSKLQNNRQGLYAIVQSNTDNTDNTGSQVLSSLLFTSSILPLSSLSLKSTLHEGERPKFVSNSNFFFFLLPVVVVVVNTNRLTPGQTSWEMSRQRKLSQLAFVLYTFIAFVMLLANSCFPKGQSPKVSTHSFLLWLWIVTKEAGRNRTRHIYLCLYYASVDE